MTRAPLIWLLALASSACQKNQEAEGPLQRAGKNVDRATRETGSALEKAADKTGQAAEKAAEKTGAALEKAGKRLKGEDPPPPPKDPTE